MRDFLYLTAIMCTATACSSVPDTVLDIGGMPPIYPDYIGVTVPENIAELKFRMNDGREFTSETITENDTIWTTVTAWTAGGLSS